MQQISIFTDHSEILSMSNMYNEVYLGKLKLFIFIAEKIFFIKAIV